MPVFIYGVLEKPFRNYYARECESHIVREQGKITGADYMLQRFLDILRTEVEPQESEDKE